MKEIKLAGLNETIYEHDHKSGLKTYMWVNEKVKSCFITLSVKYGALHTEWKTGNKKYKVPNGLAHFLEHIKFNESEDLTAHDIFYKLGADINAFTTYEYTSYVLFTTVNLNDNLNHLLDFVYNPFFSKKIIQKEKGIITEEANMTLDDTFAASYYALINNMLSSSKYKEIITGEPEDIKQITIEDIEAVFNSFYHPENMFLCITGNFNPYEMAKIIDENMDQKEFPEFIPPVIIKEKEDKNVVKKYEEIELNITNTKVKIVIKIPCNKFKNYDKLSLRIILVLLFNINFGNTSDFKDELLNKGLINDMQLTCDSLDDYFGVIFNIETEYPEEVIKRVEDKLNNLELNENVISRKKKVNIATLILDFDDVENVNSRIQDNIINYGEIITNLKEKYQELTYEDFAEVAEKIDMDNKSILIARPKKEEQKKQEN